MWSSLTDQLVRKFKDDLGINMIMKKIFTFVPVQQYKHHVRSIARSGVCPQRRPHAQQQLARDLEVKHAVMRQCCRPQSFGEV